MLHVFSTNLVKLTAQKKKSYLEMEGVPHILIQVLLVGFKNGQANAAPADSHAGKGVNTTSSSYAIHAICAMHAVMKKVGMPGWAIC